MENTFKESRSLGKAIIADDLTGAMDTGAQILGQAPATVEVQLSDRQSKGTLNEAVRIINTQTRGTSANTAVKRVRSSYQHLRVQGQRLWFKKIDSTLRGNVGAELQALHTALDSCLVICTPALPAEGRTVESGVLKVAGRPIAHTPYRDEIATDGIKIDSSSVTDIIRKQWPKCRVRNLTRSVRREDISSAFQESVDVLVVDATSDKDLRRLVAAGSDNDTSRLLWAGSAGLLNAIASYGGYSRIVSKKVPIREGPLVMVAGTRRELFKKQAAIAIDSPRKSLVSTNTVLQIWPDGEESWVVRIDRQNRKVGRAEALERSACSLRSGHDLFLWVSSPLNTVHSSPTVAHTLSSFAADALEGASVLPRALLLVGGDTAYTCLCRLGIKSIALGGEIEPYVPWGTVNCGAWSDTIIVTKAGGFGDAHTLSRVEKRLSEDYG